MISPRDTEKMGELIADQIHCRFEPGYMGQMPVSTEFFDTKDRLEFIGWKGNVLFVLTGLRSEDPSVEFP